VESFQNLPPRRNLPPHNANARTVRADRSHYMKSGEKMGKKIDFFLTHSNHGANDHIVNGVATSGYAKSTGKEDCAKINTGHCAK
jgi:hypothetical protein